LQYILAEIRRRRKKMKKLACLSVALLFSLSTSLADEPVRYTNETFARLSYINGNVYIQRAVELDYEEALMNMPISEGDRMGTTEGRAEIHMGRGKYLRLDTHTKMDFLSLPNPVNDLTRIQIWRGNIFFSILSLKREKAIEIHTEDASLYVLEPGLYRINVSGDETEILVFRGLLEAAGETGSVLIRETQRMEAINGYFTERPSTFAAVAVDSFERWNEGRELEVHKRMAQRYLPAELEDFEFELAYYGQWTYIFPYGYVWIPGGVAADWRPYWRGRWMWLPTCGWTWLPYESWGWATFHYGRWHWHASFGWYWIPTKVWGPGWVHWYSGYDYVAWAPASFWGRPGVIIDNVYYGRNADHSYAHRSSALTVIHKDQLRARDISKVALSQDAARNIEQMSLVKTQPTVKPADLGRIRPQALRSSSSSTPKTIYSPSTKLSDPGNIGRIKITSPEKKEETEERDIPKAKSSVGSRTTRTTLGKITGIFSSKSSKSTSSTSTSSKSLSAKKVESSANTKSKSSSTVKKSTSAKSSSRKSVSSKKVKKKK
jgi:hypothetical protein